MSSKRCATISPGRNRKASGQRSGRNSRTSEKLVKLQDALQCSMLRRVAVPPTFWLRRIWSSFRLLVAFVATFESREKRPRHNSLGCFLTEGKYLVNSSMNMCQSVWTTLAEWLVPLISIWTTVISMHLTSWMDGRGSTSRMSAALSTLP